MKYYKQATDKKLVRDKEAQQIVENIIDNVRERGDAELKDLAARFDKVELDKIRVTKEEIQAAYDKVDPKVVEAFKKASAQIRFYAEKQKECLIPLDTDSPIEGVRLGHRIIPVEAAGLYVPGGRYPLPSTALMLGIPAKVAGVKRVVACSPANKDFGGIHPATLVALDIAGVDEVYTVGGAQAIAAMAYGTESIAPVDLIAGPGNRFVTEAKRQVMGTVGIDSLAGPSEMCVLADKSAKAEYLAADLLAQSEHDVFSKSVLITTDEAGVPAILDKMKEYAKDMSTGELALKSFEDNGSVIIADSYEEMAELANKEASEHLQVYTENAKEFSEKLSQFGSMFIGEYSPVPLGDYCSGTNHTLPTMGTARFSNGVWVGTFTKVSFVQQISKGGLEKLSETCLTMAETEGLDGHGLTVKVRLK